MTFGKSSKLNRNTLKVPRAQLPNMPVISNLDGNMLTSCEAWWRSSLQLVKVGANVYQGSSRGSLQDQTKSNKGTQRAALRIFVKDAIIQHEMRHVICLPREGGGQDGS
jgi:hypothetical protein